MANEFPRGNGAGFQGRVQPWLVECFGEEVAKDRSERNHRFLEEALELVQAAGATQDEAHQLVRYVFGRPKGDLDQEIGGVMVTLASLCYAHGADMHAAGDVELARINQPDIIEKIRAKQATKPKFSPLPGRARDEPSITPEKGIMLVPAGPRVSLADCPEGLFLASSDCLCLKTEYGSNEGRIDAYIVSTGEAFIGGAQSIAEQRAIMVTPVQVCPFRQAAAADAIKIVEDHWKRWALGSEMRGAYATAAKLILQDLRALSTTTPSHVEQEARRLCRQAGLDPDDPSAVSHFTGQARENLSSASAMQQALEVTTAALEMTRQEVPEPDGAVQVTDILRTLAENYQKAADSSTGSDRVVFRERSNGILAALNAVEAALSQSQPAYPYTTPDGVDLSGDVVAPQPAYWHNGAGQVLSDEELRTGDPKYRERFTEPLYAAPQPDAKASGVEGWQSIETAPWAVTVLAAYFDREVGEWIVQLFDAERPGAPFTHWCVLPPMPDTHSTPPTEAGVEEPKVVAWRYCNHDIDGDPWPWNYTETEPSPDHSEVEPLIRLSDHNTIVERLKRELAVATRVHRWSVEQDDEVLRVCRNQHDKDEPCEWEAFVPQGALTTERERSARLRDEVLEEAARVAYAVCAETRHVTLGDKCAAALRELKGGA